MVAVPELQRPPPAVREHILQWYRDHQHTYARVWDRLDQVREKWSLLDREGKITLLKSSYVFSVMSVQTRVHIHEEWFIRVIHGEGVEESRVASGAGLGSRVAAMRETLADESLWDETVELLDDGHVDTAHKLLLDNAKWISTAKVPFTLANLGFTQKMCIDANIARLFAAERPETKSIESYEGLCADIRDTFPDLSEILKPYHLQWLLFDWQRFFRANSRGGIQTTRARGDMAIATHDVWFDTALGNVDRLRARLDRIPEETNGHAIEEDINGSIDAAIGRDVASSIESAVDD